MKKTVLALLATILLLFATGCGSDSSDPGSDGSGGSDMAGTLVIAMTSAQLPGLDAGTFESEGWEGERFVGMTLYDGLTKLDLKQGDTGPKIVPGLAESWSVAEDVKTWTFKLRPDVTFQDGTAWDADAAVFGFDRILNPESPHYSEDNAGMMSFFAQAIESYRKVDPMTIEITTKYPYALLPQDLPLIVFPSPTAVEKYGADFADNPVGTGPFKFSKLISGGSVEFVKNDDYWGGAPKLDRLILRPIPEATARVAALRAGEVNWVEFPAPDDAVSLESEGFEVLTNPYSHIWPLILDLQMGGPLADPKVRLALNLAIDRVSLSDNVLSGYGAPAEQYVPAPDPGYDPAGNVLTFQPEKSKALLAEAGFPDGFPMVVAYPTGGSGNMQPESMMVALQADLSKIGVDLTLKPMEWAALLSDWANGSITPGADAVVVSQGFAPQLAWGNLFGTGNDYNVGGYSNPQFDDLWGKAKVTVDDTERAQLITQMNTVLTTDNPWVVVVSDLNPRVLAPSVHGFVQPQSVWLDLTGIIVD